MHSIPITDDIFKLDTIGTFGKHNASLRAVRRHLLTKISPAPKIRQNGSQRRSLKDSIGNSPFYRVATLFNMLSNLSAYDAINSFSFMRLPFIRCVYTFWNLISITVINKLITLNTDFINGIETPVFCLA